ncbi:MAG: bifunctional non-ous end joining protein LigD [Pseudonocardiales bacterium]|jgi:bifunctional non-homologous end joining protein LigD|nr:bifunctional non-ous end joining protein LigD [Pseudonocardiales bacterium]MDT4920737.1 bifunctional non-ous end joining protein LigD [Pseudonocardiales bacterium]
MLATAVSTLPSDVGWAYEFKWDGVRALLDVTDRAVQLVSRNGNDIGGGYPELVAQAADIGDGLFDGEIVAFVDGRPSFERLQRRMHLRGKADVARATADCPVTYVLFDVLRRYGVDLTARPYTERRATLERFVEEHPGWTLSPSFDDGPATEEVARAHGLEGVVAKRVASSYRPGIRTDDWRKLRFVRAGEFVVIGWEAAPEHPNTLSSLVLGVTGDGGLRYAGRVGSGLTGRDAARLKGLLAERATPVVADVPAPVRGRKLRWVEPTVVVDVEFLMWTDDGKLRAPVYRGIRTDKSADEARGDR